MTKRPSQSRVRALFVEAMSGPVLQMLGARFNIEPFFFSSSLKWIPSRFQQEVQAKAVKAKGDHITIVVTFLRSIGASLTSSDAINIDGELYVCLAAAHWLTRTELNTQAPLYLSSGRGCYLVLDLLSIHLIRDENENNNTIISLHHTDPDSKSGAAYLHERIRFAGQSVYWQHIFQSSPDPTFVLLVFLWHAIYSWDEALEILYNHIISMEMRIMRDSDMQITRTLHFIRAHLLHYSSLLEDMRNSVQFIISTPNPAMNSLDERLQTDSRKRLEKECNHLLIEIQRLDKQLQMQGQRLENVMNLVGAHTLYPLLARLTGLFKKVFSTVSIKDSSRMQELSEAAVRDSTAGPLDEAGRIPDYGVFARLLHRERLWNGSEAGYRRWKAWLRHLHRCSSPSNLRHNLDNWDGPKQEFPGRGGEDIVLDAAGMAIATNKRQTRPRKQ
ncbi:hypothetical protein VNI00_002437 [Paramarasmius palmivorus]|uniref:Uncharacterized protein n=1 Tax=Paramarasmius palmivorus TaxID=297713 RepID=A0AAW0DY19_9AGAR